MGGTDANHLCLYISLPDLKCFHVYEPEPFSTHVVICMTTSCQFFVLFPPFSHKTPRLVVAAVVVEKCDSSLDQEGSMSYLICKDPNEISLSSLGESIQKRRFVS